MFFMKCLDFQQGEFIYFNKPYGMSSFGALAFVRTRISQRVDVKRVKTGHAGTLDPLATGVLILCTGKATKQIESLQLNDKEYTATLQFGATTPSFDKEYTVDHTYPKKHITREKVEEALKQFVGDIMQVPPVFSACNVNGKRAYELARKDKEVELQAKQVRVDEIELLDFNDELKQARIRVVCGKGTYIRSLARDIGEALDSGAYLTALCRTLDAPTGTEFRSDTHVLVLDRGRLLIEQQEQHPFREMKIPEEGTYRIGEQVKIKIERFHREDSYEIPREKTKVALDASEISFPLILRRLREADRFHPYGMKGSKLVSDYLTDQKRSLLDKRRQLVITDAQNRILWLIGERPDDRFRITVATTEILQLSI